MMEEVINRVDLNIDKSNWKLVKFGDVAFEPKEVCKDIQEEKIEHVVGLEHIDSGDIHLRKSATIEEATTFTKKFRKGDVLFGRRRAYLKKAAQAEFDGICSGDITVFRSKKDLSPDLLPFIVHNEKFFEYAIKHSAGGLSPRVKFKDLSNYEFLLPPKSEQARLAELLWAMDEVIEREGALYKIIENSKFSVLRNRIIEFSTEKQYQTLGDLGKWTSGGTPSKTNLEYWENGTIPWITPKDMKGEYLTASMDHVTDKSVQDNKAKIFKKGSIVLVWRSGILQHTLPVARVERDFCVNQDLKVFEPKNRKFIEEFVRVFLKVNSENIRRESVKEGTTVQSIDTNSFMKFRIPEIALDLQKKIIEEEVAFESAIISGFNKYITSKIFQKSLINQIF